MASPLYRLMQRPCQIVATRCWTQCATVAIGLLVTIGPAWAQGPPAGNPLGPAQAELGNDGQRSDLHSLYYSAHLPTDRRLAQDLQQARELFADERFSEGLALIDRVLGATEDTFHPSSDQTSEPEVRGLKAAARELLAELPPAGVAALELDQGARARRALSQAVATGTLADIAGVARRFPVTEAAEEATMLLAQAHVDAGRYGAAARLYEDLLKRPETAERHGPLLAVRAAMCRAAAGDQRRLSEAIERVSQFATPTARAEVLRLTGARDLASWFDTLQSHPDESAGHWHVAGWLADGGQPSRNPVCRADVPHVWPAWEARTVKQSPVAGRLEQRVDWQHRRGMPWSLVANPIAVGDLAIVRTPNNLVAVDWRTGRRIWETRPEPADDDGTLTLPNLINGQQVATALEPLDQRLWLDAVYGSLSSDGERVFAVRHLETVETSDHRRWGMRMFGRLEDLPEETGNALTAYDLRSEGKLLWEVNGESREGLDGVFFLGAPLAIGERLYALAEFGNSIHLMELEAATGEVRWQQPLCNLERSVQYDLGRRLAGAVPSFADGLVICPTGAGSVVAVDPVSRSLRWAYRFEVDESLATAGQNGWQQQLDAYQPSLTERWRRNRCLVAEGRVLVATPETTELHCLDVDNGQRLWSVDRGEHLDIVGVADGTVVLVAPQHVTLLNLEDGNSVRSPVAMPDSFCVAGNGVLSNGRLLLPLSNNHLGVLDLATAEFAPPLAARADHSLGNLIYHRGTLLSQSATAVARFDQLSSLREQLADRSPEGDAARPHALRIEGEIAWSEGQLDLAIERMLEAHAAAPDDALIQVRLSRALLAGLRTDYARYRTHDDLLDDLLADRPERIELLRLHIDGALGQQDTRAAFDYACKLFEIDREEMLALGEMHRTLGERWLAHRIARIWRIADQDVRDEMVRTVEQYHAQALEAADPSALNRLVRYFGLIPAGRKPRLELAGNLIADQRVSEAELLLLRTDPEERQAQLNGLDADRREQWGAAVGDWAANHADRSQLEAWPDGNVEVTVQSDPVRSRGRGTMAANSSARTNRRDRHRVQVTSQSCGLPWSGPRNLALTPEGGLQLVGWNQFGEVSHAVPLEFVLTNQSGDVDRLGCIRFGHFAVLGAGTEVASMDLRPRSSRSGPLLWASETDRRASRATTRLGQFQAGNLRGMIVEEDTAHESPRGELCAAAPLGVVLRDEDRLQCFDPLDGELLWQRRGVPSDGPTLGDWQHVYLAEEGSAEGVVLALADGSEVGTWKVPAGEPVAQVGRHLATSLVQSGTLHVRVVDVRSGEVLLHRQYANSARLTQATANWLVCAEPSGRCDLLDLASGAVRFETQLEAEESLEGIHALVSGDILVLATDMRTDGQRTTAGHEELENAPIVTGRVYALDANDGTARWPRPATVEGQGLWLMQPTASPVLMFVSAHQERETNSSQRSTRMLCLDKRTGRSLLRRDELPEPVSEPWSMRVDQSTEPSVRVELRHSQVVLKFTDEPRPPEPVALAEVEGVTKSVGAGLLGIGRRLFDRALNSNPTPPVDDDD